MNTPDYEIHRAIVHSSDTVTGAAEVRIPSLLGAGQVVSVPTTGLTQVSGYWNVPSPGASTFIAVSSDRTQFLWVTAITTPSSGDDRDVVDSLQFNIDAGIIVESEGLLAWNEDWGTVDIGLHGSNAVLHVGQQVYYYAKNQTGAQIDKGTVVRFDGALGASGHLKMAPFLADGTYPSEYIMGITAHDIPDGDDGYVVHFGAVRGVDTSVWTAGDVVYASPTAIGGLTSTTPSAPNNIILVAAVVNSHEQNGELFVRPTLAANILNNEGIVYTNLADNDVLAYNATTGVFENTSSLDLTTLTTTGEITVGGSRVLTTADEGTGNGLDADLLDGLHSTSFHREGQDISLGGYAVVNAGSGTNTDHFWYSDSSFSVAGSSKGGVWHFCADTSYKATGNSAVRAGGFYGEHGEFTNDVVIGNSSSGGNATIQIMAQSGYYPIMYFGDGGTNQWHYESSPGGGSFAFVESGVSQRFVVYAGGGAWVSGYLTKTGGGFRIPHPHPDLTETHDLVHNFVEAPQADNIYRGRVQLSDGTASVNIDTASGMTDGTFVLLNRDIQCFTSNEEGPCGVWGYVEGNTLHVTAQHPDCNHTISWMVIGERQDEFMITGTDATDDNGKVIVEPLKREDTPSDFVVVDEPTDPLD